MPAQGGVEDRGVFVGRTEAAGKLDGADDGVARVLEQLLEIGVCLFGMIDRANRLGVTVLRAAAFDFFKGQSRTGGDDEIVVGHFLPVGE